MLILFLYKLLTILGSLFIFLYYNYIRTKHNLETKESIKQKFCIGDFDIKFQNDRKLIWIHAVSIGEINSAWLLIKSLHSLNKYNILVTTSTLTSSKTFLNKMSTLNNKEYIKYHFYPIDVPFIVNKFLNYFKPHLFINIESENWPNVLYNTSKKCKVIGVNTKISERSFKKWMKLESFKNVIFDCFDICLTQTKEDQERLTMLGTRKVEYLGNLKFIVEKSSVDGELLNKFQNLFAGREFKWLINSIHNGEEQVVAKAHNLLKKDFENLLTCIIVRHPHEKQQIFDALKQHNITFASLADGDEFTSKTEVFVYDVIGGLGTLFEIFKIVFMAGSLAEAIGGHTPIEAAKQNCCTLTGPYICNNESLFNTLKQTNGTIVLKTNTPEEIYENIKDLLNNPEKVKEIGANAVKKINESSTLVNNILQIIEKEI